MFILGDDKRLHTKKYRDPWVNCKLLEEAFLKGWEWDKNYLGNLYSGPVPKLPIIPEKTGRIMTVKAPVIVDPPIDYMGWDD